MLKITSIFAIGVTTMLAGCGGGGSNTGSTNFSCAPLFGDFSRPCTTCSDVENEAAVTDGNINSAGTYITFRSNNSANVGQVRFISERDFNDTIAAGATPGFAVRLPVATGVSYTFTPSVLLNGAVVQTADPVTVTGNTNGEFRYFGLTAVADFTGVQLALQHNEPTGATEDFHELALFEACADGSLIN